MKPVMQTRIGKEGNCFQACLASLLELKIEEVPDFCTLYSDETWFDEVKLWLMEKRNLYILNFTGTTEVPMYGIGSGFSPRGVLHAVIVKNGVVVHDPYPSEPTDISKIKEMMLFITEP